jgi:hypothetical protein
LVLLCLILYKVNILLLELFGVSLFDYLFGVSLGCLFDVNLFGVSLDCLFDINLDYFFDINFFIVWGGELVGQGIYWDADGYLGPPLNFLPMVPVVPPKLAILIFVCKAIWSGAILLL